MFAETGALISFTWEGLESILILEDLHPSWYFFPLKLVQLLPSFKIFSPPVKGIVDPKMNIMS